MIRTLLLVAAFALPWISHAQGMRGLPSLPRSGGGDSAFQGSVGAGFADFRVLSPSQDFKLERGTFIATSLERGFNFFHLYLTMGLSYMDAEGIANYSYTNLSTSTSYALTDVDFRARTYEVSLGLRLKLIDGYWFRPYVEGGGVGNYNEISYASKITQLNATGPDFKRKDVIMGSGYYGEAGVEVQFSDRFGLRLAARQTIIQTKKLETLGNRPVRMLNETYYLSALFGL